MGREDFNFSLRFEHEGIFLAELGYGEYIFLAELGYKGYNF